MKHELKPCPFCGSKAQLVRYETKTGEVWYGVRCSNYDCIGNDISPEFGLETRAVNWWNLRSKDDGSTAQKWIPVTERLPEELQKECCAWSERVRPSVDVLVKIKGSKTLYTAWYSYSYKEWTDVREEHTFIGVTHWMPLPEPPKEVE